MYKLESNFLNSSGAREFRKQLQGFLYFYLLQIYDTQDILSTKLDSFQNQNKTQSYFYSIPQTAKTEWKDLDEIITTK